MDIVDITKVDCPWSPVIGETFNYELSLKERGKEAKRSIAKTGLLRRSVILNSFECETYFVFYAIFHIT